MIDCLDLSIRYVHCTSTIINIYQGTTYINSNVLPYLLFFFVSTNIEQKAREICANEELLGEEYLPELKLSLRKLQKKLHIPVKNKFYHFKSLKTNLLPLTNVAFNKEGNRYRKQRVIKINSKVKNSTWAYGCYIIPETKIYCKILIYQC